MNELQAYLQEDIDESINTEKQIVLSDEEKIESIENHFREILKILGLDLTHKSIQKTPKRIAKMYVEELFSGLKGENFPKISFLKQEKSKGPILIKNISICSICEHHFIPMVGTAHIAYIPSGTLIGLSKVNRIAQHFAKRPQIQERLTMQIGDCLSNLLQTEDIAVSIELNHFCVTFRGIADNKSTTQTEYLKGEFQSNSSVRQEFFTKIS